MPRDVCTSHVAASVDVLSTSRTASRAKQIPLVVHTTLPTVLVYPAEDNVASH